MKLRITNGRVIDPANQLDSQHDIYISDDKIVAISDHYPDFTADQTIDASGLIVCPGLVELSARLESQAKSTPQLLTVKLLLQLKVE